MPKTEFLQIRVTPDDRERFRLVAESEYLDVSTWARRVLMQAAERWESRQTVPKRVAETPPEPPDQRKRRK